MKLAPYVVAIGILMLAAYRREWFDLAWAATLVLLIGFDAIVSSMNATASTRSVRK